MDDQSNRKTLPSAENVRIRPKMNVARAGIVRNRLKTTVRRADNTLIHRKTIVRGANNGRIHSETTVHRAATGRNQPEVYDAVARNAPLARRTGDVRARPEIICRQTRLKCYSQIAPGKKPAWSGREDVLSHRESANIWAFGRVVDVNGNGPSSITIEDPSCTDRPCTSPACPDIRF